MSILGLYEIEDEPESGRALPMTPDELAAIRARCEADPSAYVYELALLDEVARLRAAVLLARNRDYDGGPCWCWVDVNGGQYRHSSVCLEFREILGIVTKRPSLPSARHPNAEGTT